MQNISNSHARADIKVYDKDSLKCLPDQSTSFFRLKKIWLILLPDFEILEILVDIVLYV